MRKRTCRRLVWVWVAFALLTALGLPGASYACTCAVAPSESYPADGATVPSNAKFWLSWPRAIRNLSPERQHRVPSSVRWHGGLGPSVTADDVVLAHRLVGPAGETIPFGVSTLLVGRGQRPAYFVLSPTRPLGAGLHTLQVLYPSPGSHNVSVTVERRALTAPPDVPRVEFLPLSTPVGAGSCSHGFYFSFHAPHRGIVTVLGLTREVRALPERPGWVSDVFDSTVGTVGSAPCRSNWDFRDGPIFTRVGAFDIAGNFSGWSDAVHLEVTEEEFEAWDRSAVASIARNFGVPRESPRGCACSLRDKDASRALPSAVLGLLLLCGRRRSLWGVRRGAQARRHGTCSPPSGNPRSALGRCHRTGASSQRHGIRSRRTRTGGGVLFDIRSNADDHPGRLSCLGRLHEFETRGNRASRRCVERPSRWVASVCARGRTRTRSRRLALSSSPKVARRYYFLRCCSGCVVRLPFRSTCAGQSHNIRPGMQRLGIGTAILESLEAQAREWGLSFIELGSRSTATRKGELEPTVP